MTLNLFKRWLNSILFSFRTHFIVCILVVVACLFAIVCSQLKQGMPRNIVALLGIIWSLVSLEYIALNALAHSSWIKRVVFTLRRFSPFAPEKKGDEQKDNHDNDKNNPVEVLADPEYNPQNEIGKHHDKDKYANNRDWRCLVPRGVLAHWKEFSKLFLYSRRLYHRLKEAVNTNRGEPKPPKKGEQHAKEKS